MADLIKKITTTGLVGLTALTLASGCSQKIQIPTQKDYGTEISRKANYIPEAPYHNYQGAECAGYATRTGIVEFKKNYQYADAWNLVYENKKIASVKEPTQLLDFIDNNILQPGMLVAFYNPYSNYNNYTDKTGKKVRCTHIAVFAGIDLDEQPKFYHFYDDKMEKISFSGLMELGLRPVEIIDEDN